MIALSFDIEWAPDEVVDECINLLVRKHIPATLFCTNPETDSSGNSSSLAGRYPGNIELGLHPNFNETEDFRSVFQHLLKFYSTPKGFRSHYMFNSWSISLLAHELGMHYESNYMLYGTQVNPFKINMEFLDFYNFPIYFMDSPTLTVSHFQWHYTSLNDCHLFDDPNFLFVFDFHPNILFYDLSHQDQYSHLKTSYHDVNHKQSYKHKQLEGAMKMYQSLLHNFPTEVFTTIEYYGAQHTLW